MIQKFASENKILAKKFSDTEINFTNLVSAPDGTDLSDWVEFNNEDEAYTYFGVEKSKENNEE